MDLSFTADQRALREAIVQIVSDNLELPRAGGVVEPRTWHHAERLARMPQGPWARIAAETQSTGNGIGVVDATLSDLAGDVGHAHQTLFLDRSKR